MAQLALLAGQAEADCPHRYLHDLDSPLDADAIEEVVAVIECELDDGWEQTGRCNVICHVEGAEGGLWGVPSDDALAFAQRFTDVIRIRHSSGAGSEERTHSAGSRPIPGLPTRRPRP